jgi:hypothetical protein
MANFKNALLTAVHLMGVNGATPVIAERYSRSTAEAGIEYSTVPQIREMIAAGMTFGSQTNGNCATRATSTPRSFLVRETDPLGVQVAQ